MRCGDGAAIRRSSWCCRAAGPARSGGCWRHSVPRSRVSPSGPARWTWCCRPCRIFYADTRGRCRLAVAAAHRQRARRRSGRHFARRERLSRRPAPSRSNWRLRRFRPLRLIGCRCLRRLVLRAARTPEISTVILANLVIGENVVPEFLQRDCTADNLAQAVIPLLSDTPQRQRQMSRFPSDSIRSWVSAPCRPAGRPPPSCLISPGAAAAISAPSAQRRSHVNRRAFRTALPMRRPSC